jgi:hypothetical protein
MIQKLAGQFNILNYTIATFFLKFHSLLSHPRHGWNFIQFILIFISNALEQQILMKTLSLSFLCVPKSTAPTKTL